MSAPRGVMTAVAVAAQTHLKSLGPRARRRRRVAAQYLRGSGIEIGALHNPLRTTASVRYVDRLSRAELRRHYPELAALPVVEPDIIDDGESLTRVPDDSQDFIIANHFIEHCEDPIGTLKTFARRLRAGGIVYMVVPDKRFTFDKRRPSTEWGHLVQDHGDGGAASRWDHYVEFAELAALPDKERRSATERAEAWAAESYSIHFHVWTTKEFEEFLEHARREHLRDLELIESVRNGDESIFVLRRSR